MSAMPLPPLNLTSSASSKSGDAFFSLGPKTDSFNVNYGSGGINAVPWWAWAAVGAAAFLWIKRKG